VSRLDSFIRRVSAQRDCLNHAFKVTAEVPGPILEFGLGNGRTYHHLRENCPDREIFVFEWKVTAHPDCTPDAGHLFEGNIYETLPRVPDRFGAPAVMAHTDIVSGDDERDGNIAAFLSERLPSLMAERAVILSDQYLDLPQWQVWDLPNGVPLERYFYYTRGLQMD
jgi:hypothetical protein